MRHAILASALLLCSCATHYQRENFWRCGYSDYRVSQDRFCVAFSGNKHTSRERAEQLALLRAAELTKSHGYSHFVVLGREDDSTVRIERSDWNGEESDYPDTWTFATMRSVGSKAAEPRITLRIRCFGSEEAKPDSAICAADYIEFNRPQ